MLQSTMALRPTWGKKTSEQKGKWKNKQRVLVFSARGVNYRSRHLMTDIRMLLPHSRTDFKLDRKSRIATINEICEMKNCTKCAFFEMRKKKDLYMWLSNVPFGPSAKFLLQNVHTMDELKLAGNCLLGARPLLSFDIGFNSMLHLEVLKEMFIQVFGTPANHSKAKPFADHVLHFGVIDDRIWFRNYQICDSGLSLTEIGPRFVLQLIKIFEGSFGGPTLYENQEYRNPNSYRHSVKAHKYRKRRAAHLAQKKRKEPAVS